MSGEFDTYRELTESQSPGDIAAEHSAKAHQDSHVAFHSSTRSYDIRHRIASMQHSKAGDLHTAAAKEVNDHGADGAALKHFHTVTAAYHQSLAKLHSAPSQFSELIPKHYTKCS